MQTQTYKNTNQNCDPIFMDSLTKRLYVPNPSAQAWYDTRSILSGIQLDWIQSFPSPRLVAIQQLKNPVCFTIYPYLGEELLNSRFPKVLTLCEIQTVSFISMMKTILPQALIALKRCSINKFLLFFSSFLSCSFLLIITFYLLHPLVFPPYTPHTTTDHPKESVFTCMEIFLFSIKFQCIQLNFLNCWSPILG